VVVPVSIERQREERPSNTLHDQFVIVASADADVRIGIVFVQNTGRVSVTSSEDVDGLFAFKHLHWHCSDLHLGFRVGSTSRIANRYLGPADLGTSGAVDLSAVFIKDQNAVVVGIYHPEICLS
jgi:hypothetical protein